MAYPTAATPLSFGNTQVKSFLTAPLAGSYVSGQTFTVDTGDDESGFHDQRDAVWYELTSTGSSENPLGTSGPFCLLVDSEVILCSAIVLATGVVTVWTDGTLNGRGYDFSPIVAHSAGSLSNLNVRPYVSNTTLLQVQDVTSGTTSTGSPIVRHFPFTYTSANIGTTGFTLYTPTVGDVLLDFWVEIDTAFDGTSPLFDLGVFTSTDAKGWFAAIDTAVDASVADLATQANAFSLEVLSQNSGASGGGSGYAASIGGTSVHFRYVPGKFVAADPIKAVVTRDGNTTVAAHVQATSAATVPTTVITGTNDEFVFNSVTYTVAAGTYSTLATLQAAMAAALHSTTAFSTVITLSNNGTKLIATDATGIGHSANTLAFATGANDFLAASGFGDAQALAGGTGGATGATAGAGTVYIVTATPV